MSIWDDPDLAPAAESYLRLDNEGDSFEGTITAIRTQVWDDGSKCPQLTLKLADGSEAAWSAGQMQAKRKLAELRPEVGDYLRVVYLRKEKRAGNKTLKHLDIQVDRGGRAVAPTTPAGFATGSVVAPAGATAGATAGGIPSGVDPAAWSTLDRATQHEMLARMGLATDSTTVTAQAPF